jgi:hypothetical protein
VTGISSFQLGFLGCGDYYCNIFSIALGFIHAVVETVDSLDARVFGRDQLLRKVGGTVMWSTDLFAMDGPLMSNIRVHAA